MMQRQRPTPEQRTAREMFLDCHRPKIVWDYQLPHDDIHFDGSCTELLLGDRMLGEAALPFLSTLEGYSRISRLRENHKRALEARIETPTDFRKDWNAHLDYESIIMDKFIDFSAVPCDVLVPSGNSFFEQHMKIALMHQGQQLAETTQRYAPRAQWFSQWTDDWYVQNALTKHRLLFILKNYTDDWKEQFARDNPPRFDTLDETFDAMKLIYDRQRITAAKAQTTIRDHIKRDPCMAEYTRFVVEAMDYNEELRLLRSRSVYNFIQGCRHNRLEPYDEFCSVLSERKRIIEDTYGGRHD